MEISIDLETYSDLDLTKVGVYKYVDSPNFKILLMAYRIESEKTKIIDFTKNELIPDKVMEMLKDDKVIKKAFNATFERVCLSKHLGFYLDPKAFKCTQVLTAVAGLPLKLGRSAKALNLKNQKLDVGKPLIRKFCTPAGLEALKKKGNLNYEEDWKDFKTYCVRDVDTEIELSEKLRKINMSISDFEKDLYVIDQKINDKGLTIDKELVINIVKIIKEYKSYLMDQLQEKTGIENPNSRNQFLSYLVSKGVRIKNNAGLWVLVDNIQKATLKTIIEAKNVTPEVYEVIEMKLELNKSSLKKFETLLETLIPVEDRFVVKGVLQFYGANRTGRWAGRLFQVHNLPRTDMDIKELDIVRDGIKKGNIDLKSLMLLYDNPSKVLVNLIRTVIIPSSSYKVLITADFSAIEARILSWIAGEEWRIKVFNTHGKIYEASASAMFDVHISKITKDSPLRQKGKIAELALGYGGGAGALKATGADMEESELETIKVKWRRANPNIVKYWKLMEKAFKMTIDSGLTGYEHPLIFGMKDQFLFVTLPSGRSLFYYGANIVDGEIVYYGSTTEFKNPEDEEEEKTFETSTMVRTYGGKIVENIVQAIARDILAFSIKNLHDAGFNMICHVHDEVIFDEDMDLEKIEKIREIMETPPDWANDLKLKVDIQTLNYYRK